jgi:guanylate kinase
VQKSGKVCILDIDVQGVRNVKKSALKPYYIFVAPPSMEQLEKRLRGRGTEKEEDIQTRLGNAAQEMAYGQQVGEFDLYLTNGDLKTSFETLVSKVKSLYPNLHEVAPDESDSRGGFRPIVFCGPSGAGKGTMIDLLMKRFPDEQFGFSVSHTTRGPRDGEQDGVHYNFTTVDQIKQEIAEGKFIEHAEVHGRYYGTSVTAVESVQSAGKVCILDIDVQGVKNVKTSALKPHYVFVAPPSMKQLEQRLRGRGTEKEEDIQTRLGNAAEEMSYGQTEGEFDFYLTNASLESALEQLAKVIMEWYPSLVEASKPASEAAATPAVAEVAPATTSSSEAPASPSKSSASLAATEAATPRAKVSSAIKKTITHTSNDGPSPLVDDDAAAVCPPLPQILSPEKVATPLNGGVMTPPTSVSIPPQDTLGSCIRSLDKFVARTKPKIPYDAPKKKRGQTDVPPVRVLTKLTGVNWLGAFVGATHYGLNYNSPYIGECVGAMNQLLDALDDVTLEQQKLKDIEKPRPYQQKPQELASEANQRRTSAVNKLIAAYVHLLATWSSYSNLQQAAAAAALADQNGNGAVTPRDAAAHSEPPVSSQLLCWAVDTAETMVAHGCFDASVATAAAANSTTPSRGSDPLEAHVSPIQQLSDAVCRVDLASEESELAALKFILTTGCRTCTTPVGHLSMLHGKDLLQLIRTAYHVYLKTGSEPNKTTARAALQQLVASVFQRMDVQDSLGIAATGAKTIGPSDVLSLVAAAAAGGGGGAVPAAAAAKALGQEGPFDSPFPQKRMPPTTPTAATPAKGEVLEQFFNDHPDVKQPAPTLQQSDAWYPSVAASLDLTVKVPATSAAATASGDAKAAAASTVVTRGKSSRSATSSGSGVNSSNGAATAAMSMDDMTGGGRAATFESPSHLDAFLVLRSLCKLSMKTLPDHMNVATSFSASGLEQEDERGLAGANGANGLTGVNPAMESKILALELLLYVLDHATPSAALFSTPSFSFAIRNYLCVSLLKNCTSNNTRIVALSLRLFIPIIRHFREGLKTEIEAFVTNVFFVILDSPNSTVEHKSLVVTLFQEICSCEDTLAEIFLNYDCDLSAVDLFHRIVTTLSRAASKVGGETDFSDRGVFSSGNHQSMALRQAHRELKLSAMRALRQVLASLYESLKVQGMDARFALGAGGGGGGGTDSITAMSGDGASVYSGNPSLSSYDATAASSSTMIGSSLNHASTPKNAPHSDNINNKAASSSSIVKMYDSKKKRREQEIEIYLRFNKKPAAGIKFAGDSGFLDVSSPVEVAKFLHSVKEKVDKTQIGDYLGREPEFQGGFGVLVLHAYVDMLDFSEMAFDDAIRYFLSGFRLPGEAQKVRTRTVRALHRPR